MGISSSPPPPSASSREFLREFSPAAARLIAGRPSLARFIDRPPSLRVLSRFASAPSARVESALRLMRRRVFIHCAAFEARGGSPLESGRVWSAFADLALQLADRVAYRELCARYGEPQEAQGGTIGRALFALGKLGSRELNPSSDVDLLFVYATDAGHVGSGSETPHGFFTRWAQRVRDLLARATPEGFVFRVDLDLRPEGTTGPLVNSIDALESYYETFGATWERAALLRLRAIVDEGAIAAEVHRRLRPFVFPRTQDLRAIDDLHAMKHRVTAAAATHGFDVKRGMGGIREVEFVAHVFQLLYGGKMPELRHGAVVETLALLEERGLLPHRMVKELSASYVFLRRLEHALQYWEDRQTQLLPDDGPVWTRSADVFARAERAPDEPDAFRARLEFHRSRIHRVFEMTLGDARDTPSEPARLALVRSASDEVRIDALSRLGFVRPADAYRCVRALERRSASPFSPRYLAARASSPHLGAMLLDGAAESPDPDVALARLIDLFSGIVPASLCARLAAEPRLIALWLRVLAVSAPLARLLARQRDLETVLLGDAFSSRLSLRQLRAELVAGLDPDDEEARLVRMRRIHGRVTLAVGVAFLSGRLDVVSAGHRLSLLADAILHEACDLARQKVARRYGEPTDARFSVCALGRLGGRELGFFADVDLIFIYQGAGSTGGPKSILSAEWAARVAQQVIWMVGAPLMEGRCYEVDTRLRPSGNQGPLVTELAAFCAYHARPSALWERQSLLRLRSVVAEPELARAIARARADILRRAPDEHLGTRLHDMRMRMERERAKGGPGSIDLKLGAGGSADIDFVVQGLQLLHGAASPEVLVPSLRRALRRLVDAGHLEQEGANELRSAYDALLTLRELLALVDDRRAAPIRDDDRRLALLERMQSIPEAMARLWGAQSGLYAGGRATTHAVRQRALELWSSFA